MTDAIVQTPHAPLIQNVLDADLAVVDRAEGVWLWDIQGKDYIDGCSGAVVCMIGHAHPRILQAIRAQSERVTFTHRGAFTNRPLQAAAELLTEMTGYAGAWFVNSGSEAVEAAMQFALQYYAETGEPQRTRFLSARRGYHGNTLGALSASGHARRTTVAPIALDIPALPAPYGYRDQGDRTEAEYTADLLAEARAVFAEHGDTIAGVLIEPVGGATLAATVPPAGYLAGLKALCDESGALFIADEVMTGLGRTGAMLASVADGVTPDLVALGKAVGAGYAPVAATLVSERVLGAIAAGSGRILGGHTYAGNPQSAATALAVLETIRDERVIERGVAAAARLRAGLEALATRHPLIGDVRGRGLQLGVEFVQDRATRSVTLAQGALAAKITSACFAEGLLIYPTTGGFVDAAQVAPPLTITDAETDELLARFDRALTAVEAELRRDGLLADVDAQPADAEAQPDEETAR